MLLKTGILWNTVLSVQSPELRALEDMKTGEKTNLLGWGVRMMEVGWGVRVEVVWGIRVGC